MKERRTLEEILRSTSDVLFPDECGQKRVELGSRGADGDTPLHVMAWRDDVYGVMALIAAGAEIDVMGDMGQTPLHVAVMRQNEKIAEMLLDAGADPDVRSEFGDTPRELAQRHGHPMSALFTRRVVARRRRAKPGR